MPDRAEKREVVVFTNGCFDLLHPGHLDLLEKARALGTRLVVGINSDRSVRAIKGRPRPFLDENSRAELLRGLRAVDEVRIFDENTPEKLIREIKPQVLVKGGDWTPAQIVGADFVLQNGGRVLSLPFEKDFSSSKIAEKIKESNLTDQPAVLAANKTHGEIIKTALESRIETFENFLEFEIPAISKCAEMIIETINEGRRVIFCTDDPGAETWKSLALEVAKKFKVSEKSGKRIFAISADSFFFDSSKEPRPEGFPQSGDLFIYCSEGSISVKILSAAMKAREAKCRTIALTGAGGKKLASLCDANISVPSTEPTRIREAQLSLINIWSQLI